MSSFSQMTSRERVAATVKGLPTDHVPVMYWINPHAACRMIASRQPAKSALWNFLGRRFWLHFNNEGFPFSRKLRNAMPLLIQIYANSRYLIELGADLAGVPFGTTDLWGKLYFEKGKIRVKDAFGSIRGMGGIYLEVVEPSIKKIDDLVNLELPDATSEKHYDRIRSFRAQNPHACIFSDNFGVQDLPMSQIWEMSAFMMAMMEYPEQVKKFQQRFADWNIDVARRSIAAGADVIFLYDDYGYTGRPLLSMEMWKEFTYPHLKRQIEAIHEAGGMCMLHSCGFQTPFLEHYVEAGLDILQSFQPKAGNNFSEAYRKYGDRLTFATGIDTQQGESMTPDEMRKDILKAYRTGGKKGHHILGMTHMLQYTMPEQNMEAIFKTVEEIKAGEHDE